MAPHNGHKRYVTINLGFIQWPVEMGVGGLLLLLVVFFIGAWLFCWIPPGRTQTLAAANFAEADGVVIGTDKLREGMVWSGGDGSKGSRVVYRFRSIPCKNRMQIEAASGESRPVRITLNGNTWIAESALSKKTGPSDVTGYGLNHTILFDLGDVQLGLQNVLEVSVPQGSSLPHLVQFIFTCSH